MKNRQFAWQGSALAVLFLLPCAVALADDGTSNVPAPNSQGQQPFHPNLYKFTAQHWEEKPFSGNPRETNGPGFQQNKPVGPVEPGTGLHWTTIDSHPGVNYQIDKNEELRLHLNGHGAKASFALHF